MFCHNNKAFLFCWPKRCSWSRLKKRRLRLRNTALHIQYIIWFFVSSAIYNYFAKMTQYRNIQEIPLILVGTQGEDHTTTPPPETRPFMADNRPIVGPESPMHTKSPAIFIYLFQLIYHFRSLRN